MATPHSSGSAHAHGHLIHWARGYDHFVRIVTLGGEGRLRRRMVEAAGLAPGERVLDVGCGTGSTGLAAARRVGAEGEVTGIDPSPEMIGRAIEKTAAAGLTLEFHTAGAEAIPLPDASVDVAISSFAFHHLTPEIQRAGLAEILRTLRPGGRLAIFDFDGGGPLLHRLASRHGSDSRGGFAQLARDAEAAGFVAIETPAFRPRFVRHLAARRPAA